jgi:anti-sigma factor (TIGR02949 family)
MPDERGVPEIDCRAAVTQLWDYLDQELTPDRLEMVRRHLESCERCLPHHDFGKRFLAALKAVRHERVMSSEVRGRVMAKLAEEGFVGSGERGGESRE